MAGEQNKDNVSHPSDAAGGIVIVAAIVALSYLLYQSWTLRASLDKAENEISQLQQRVAQIEWDIGRAIRATNSEALGNILEQLDLHPPVVPQPRRPGR